MSAWGCGLRSSLPWAIRDITMSSANFVSPTTLAQASILGSDWPMIEKRSFFMSELSPYPLGSPAAALPSHAQGGELDRIQDLRVARAPAEIPGQGVLDLVAGRDGDFHEEGLRGEEDARRAVPALGRPQLREGLLQRVKPAVFGHALHRLDLASLTLHGQRQAGQHGIAVHQHGARAALAQLAAVLGAGEVQLLAEHLEESLVRRREDIALFPVDLERQERGHRVGLQLLNDETRIHYY